MKAVPVRGSPRNKRLGVSVFVNFVSKRIHPSTLKEAFREYGKVVDVYIAYKNVRRAGMRSTFAFVRFSTMDEALIAVSKANNRRMDGFRIKVFLSKSLHGVVKPRAYTRDEVVVTNKANARKVSALVVESRSCRDAILRNEKVISGSDRKEEAPIFGDPISITPEINDCWLQNSLVGQISATYDVQFVQQILISEGFKVRVCSWYGFYVIICFEEVEQIEIFWDLRESVLKPWFSDIDTVDNFMIHNKLKVWVCIEGVPLEVWSESGFKSITKHWGNFIRLDNDTANRSRLDVARILVGVKCLSVIPPVCSIEHKGIIAFLRISTAEFDDDRCWIDGEKVYDGPDIDPVSLSWNWEKPCLGKPHGINRKEVENDKKSSLFDDNGVKGIKSKFGTDESHSKFWVKPACDDLGSEGDFGAHINMGSSNSIAEGSGERPTGNEDLFDVKVLAASETNTSSGHSVSLEPVFDSVSGLFSIKPKVWNHGVGNNIASFCSNLKLGRKKNVVSSPSRANSVPLSGKYRTMINEGCESSPIGEEQIKENGFNCMQNNVSEAERAEALATLEVCEAVGLFFNKDREEVLSKIVELGNFFECVSSRITQHYLAVVEKCLSNNFKCVVVNVYGPIDVEERRVVSDLKFFILKLNLPVF
ncbi:hypothetical protein GQ457_08G032390 [Hibiscus cannabinus]